MSISITKPPKTRVDIFIIFFSVTSGIIIGINDTVIHTEIVFNTPIDISAGTKNSLIT